MDDTTTAEDERQTDADAEILAALRGYAVLDLDRRAEDRAALDGRWSEHNVAVCWAGGPESDEVAWDPDALLWRQWTYYGWREHPDIVGEIAWYLHGLVPNNPSLIKQWGSLGAARAVEQFGRGLKARQFDEHPNLVGLPRHPHDALIYALDTSTGEVQQQEQDDHITRTLAYFPAPRPSQAWLEFVDECLSAYAPPERALVAAYLRQWAGAALSGKARRSDGLLFLLGPTGTGKSKFTGVLHAVLGGYSTVVNPKNILKDGDDHLSWLAAQQGARLVWIDEVPRRGAWQTEHVNALVDGRPITANRMRRDPVTFTSEAHVMVTGNFAPHAEQEEGVWSRLAIVRFENHPTVDRTDLLEELLDDGDGVLAWIVEGLRDNARRALAIPDVLRQEAERVKAEANSVALFVQERIERDPEASVTSADLLADWREWFAHNGEGPPISERAFASRLTALGLPKTRSIRDGNARGRVGVRLLPKGMNDNTLD